MSKFIETPEGWHILTKDLEEQLTDIGCSVIQMKQKFAELRVYYRPVNKQADLLIERCNEICVVTCEICGKPGTSINDGGLLRIACEEHIGVFS